MRELGNCSKVKWIRTRDPPIEISARYLGAYFMLMKRHVHLCHTSSPLSDLRIHTSDLYFLQSCFHSQIGYMYVHVLKCILAYRTTALRPDRSLPQPGQTIMYDRAQIARPPARYQRGASVPTIISNGVHHSRRYGE